MRTDSSAKGAAQTIYELLRCRYRNVDAAIVCFRIGFAIRDVSLGDAALRINGAVIRQAGINPGSANFDRGIAECRQYSNLKALILGTWDIRRNKEIVA
jgi:hypothetical protein